MLIIKGHILYPYVYKISNFRILVLILKKKFQKRIYRYF